MADPTGDLRGPARQHVRQLPAVTARGSAGPAGGGDDDPQVLDRAAHEKGVQQQVPEEHGPPAGAHGLVPSRDGARLLARPVTSQHRAARPPLDLLVRVFRCLMAISPRASSPSLTVLHRDK